MKVIAGSKRATTLYAPPDQRIRPTLNRVKEDVFNICQNRVGGSVFLDLFCGSAQMGIEALSRGAQKAVFVDACRQSLALARKNVAKCGFLAASSFVKKDALDFIVTTKQKYDIIYLDPPYVYRGVGKLLEALFAGDVLGDEGIVILEQARDGDERAWLSSLAFAVKRVKQYAGTTLYFLQRMENDDETGGLSGKL